MLSAERIRRFIRHTLGCVCPDEVFRSVDVQRHVRLNSFIVLDSALIIGNRLLIYIAEARTEACVEEHLPVLFRAGKDERDTKGLNRFRLVLVSDRPDAVRRTAGELFEELRGNDEKAHLHVVHRSEMPFTTEDTGEKSEGKKERR